MALLFVMLTCISHVISATIDVEHELATLKELVMQQTSEISTLKGRAKYKERQSQKHREQMDERLQQIMSEIDVLKKKAKDGDDAIETLKDDHRKEMNILTNDIHKLEKELTVCRSTSKSILREAFKRDIQRKYIADIQNMKDKQRNLEKQVAESRIEIRELERTQSIKILNPSKLTEYGHNSESDDKHIYQTGDAGPGVTDKNNKGMSVQRQWADSQISDTHVKRKYIH